MIKLCTNLRKKVVVENNHKCLNTFEIIVITYTTRDDHEKLLRLSF